MIHCCGVGHEAKDGVASFLLDSGIGEGVDVLFLEVMGHLLGWPLVGGIGWVQSVDQCGADGFAEQWEGWGKLVGGQSGPSSMSVGLQLPWGAP